MARNIVYTCDCCGDVIQDPESISSFDMVYSNQKFFEDVVPPTWHMDLCPKCAYRVTTKINTIKEMFNQR